MRRVLKLQEALDDKVPTVILVCVDGSRQSVPAEEAFIKAASLYFKNRVVSFETGNKDLEASLKNAYDCMFPACETPYEIWADDIGRAIVPAGFWDAPKSFPYFFPYALR